MARRFLPVLVVLAVALIVWLPTLGWGLPSRDADRYLFGDRRPWTGREILALTATTQPTTARGADVDADPIVDRSKPVILNDTDAKRAAIVRRYRLMSGQPDEFIQFKALSEMAARPGLQKLDPRLYQYGGLWMYPVGAMVRGAMLVGLIESPPPGVPALEFYLDRPDAFGRFYVVARFYSWCWGIVAALAIVWLARRITGSAPLATLAAVAFMLTPVVRAATHEAKPHLAGAALCLCAVIAATRYVETGRRRWAIAAGALCGAAMAMVVSMLLSIVVLPTMVCLRRRAITPTRVGSDRASVDERTDPTPQGSAWGAHAIGAASDDPVKPTPAGSEPSDRRAPLDPTRHGSAWITLFTSLACAAIVYVATNPFVIYNAVANPDILRSNLGNSTAMYSPQSSGWDAIVSAVVILLIGFGAFAPATALAGCTAVLLRLRNRGAATQSAKLLAIVTLIVLAQFVLLAAGKPAEYARFGIVITACLTIIAAAAFAAARPRERLALGVGSVLLLAPFLAIESRRGASAPTVGPIELRHAIRATAAERTGRSYLLVNWEPAPWATPPCDLFGVEIVLIRMDPSRDRSRIGVFPTNLASQIGAARWAESVDWRDNKFGVFSH